MEEAVRIEDKIRLNYEALNRVENQKDKKENRTEDRAENQIRKEDRVELSESRKQVEELKNRVKNSEEVRAEKVEAIKKQIENGTYDVSGKKVADKIINLAINDLF